MEGGMTVAEHVPVSSGNAGVMNEQMLYEEANRLYLTDAEFHALVDTAVGVAELRFRVRMGERFPDEYRLVATQTAAMVLVLQREANP